MMDHITDEIATAENELTIYKEMKKSFSWGFDVVI